MNQSNIITRHAPLTAPLLDILTDSEKDALMNHRIQLRRAGKHINRQPSTRQAPHPSTQDSDTRIAVIDTTGTP